VTSLRWLSATLFVALSSAVVACPPRQTEIVITDAGAATLVSTCNSGVDTLTIAEDLCRDYATECVDANCDALDCEQLDQLCISIGTLSLSQPDCATFRAECLDQATQCGGGNRGMETCNMIANGCGTVVDNYSEVCGVPDHVTPDLSAGTSTPLGVQIVLTSGLDTDALTASGCGVAQVDGNAFATGINEAIQQAIGDGGLTHDDLDAPEDALPIMLLFHDRNGDGIRCGADELFACAALGRRSPSEESYDVLCGSCQKGLRPAVPTAPCDRECILPYCLSLLEG
jgi:hypothetical protein